MGFKSPNIPKPKPTPVPTIDPATVGQQTTEVEGDDKQDKLTKKKQGKKSLMVDRGSGAGATGLSTSKGMSSLLVRN